MRLSRLPILLLSSLLLVLPLRLLAQGSPYQVTVPVTDTSEGQRDQAFGAALGQVMARVAGGQDLRGKSGYDDALKQAGGLVQQYQYLRGGSADGLALTLRVSFDSGSVQRLVGQLGVSAAGLKPPVLLLVQGADGKPLGQDALAPLAQAAAGRGYDSAYADAASAPDQAKLTAADPAVLGDVARKYHTGLVLLGRLHGGNAEWTLVAGGKAQHWTSQGTAQATLLQGAAAAMADRLGQQLNVISGGTGGGNLWVSGLHSAMDYANLLAALRSDPSISQVNTLGADGDGVLLALKTSLPLDALTANLAAGGRLLQGDAHPGADASLRWLH